MDPRRQAICKQIISLLECGQRVLGIRLCLHSRILQYDLPRKWRSHVGQACRNYKQAHIAGCIHFARIQVPLLLQHAPTGSIHRCPAGFTEIAAAVFVDGIPDGVLFGGTFLHGPSKLPVRGLLPVTSAKWLKDRLRLLRALAAEIGGILGHLSSSQVRSRRAEIIASLRTPQGLLFELKDLARVINLSPSRTGHAIREIFSTTFPKLLLSIRLDEGCRLLAESDRTITDIAHSLGFSSQSHFTSSFRAQIGLTPAKFRSQLHTGGSTTA